MKAPKSAKRRTTKSVNDLLLEVGASFTSTLDLDEVLERILSSLDEAIAYDSASVMLLVDGALVIRAARGFPPGLAVIGARFDLGRFPTNREIIETGKPKILADARLDPVWITEEPLPGADEIRSWMGVPLRVEGRVIGMMCIDGREANLYGEEDLLFATAFANQAAIAVENARVHGLLKQRVRELGAVGMVGAALSERRDVRSLCEVVGESLKKIFEVEVVFVALYDAAIGKIEFPYFVTAGRRVSIEPVALGKGLTSIVIASRRPLCLVEDGPRRQLELGGILVAETVIPRSWLGVPILSGDEVIGVVSVQDLRREKAFGPEDISLLETIASTVGAGIQNARYLEETRRQAERNAALLVEARAARAEAEEANRLKSQFLATMSHELRTPLNSIINLAFILQAGAEGELGESARDLVSRIEGAGSHLLHLINEILDFSKIEAGKMELAPEELSLRELAEEAASTIDGLLGEKPVRFVLDLPEGLVPLFGDRTRVRQILMNILSNAAKFTDQGLITLRARREGDSIRIDVEDTGVGMAPEDIPKAFADFVQLDGDLDRRATGTGLGLPIVKRLVALHGGRIWAESSPGRGSVFHFTLPRDKTAFPFPAESGEGGTEAGIGTAAEVGPARA